MTQLSPLEEALFQSWARAHRIDNQDDPNNKFDHRGVYKRTNGLIHPPGHINQMAAEHNAAQEGQEGGEALDPAMALVEHQKNQMDAEKAKRSDMLKVQLAERAHAQKMQLETMKLQHKSMESEKDRAHKFQEAERSRQVQAEQAQNDRQNSLQDLMIQRHHAVQDQQVDRQNSLQDQASSQQADVHGKMVSEHLARTRPAEPSSTSSS